MHQLFCSQVSAVKLVFVLLAAVYSARNEGKAHCFDLIADRFGKDCNYVAIGRSLLLYSLLTFLSPACSVQQSVFALVQNAIIHRLATPLLYTLLFLHDWQDHNAISPIVVTCCAFAIDI